MVSHALEMPSHPWYGLALMIEMHILVWCVISCLRVWNTCNDLCLLAMSILLPCFVVVLVWYDGVCDGACLDVWLWFVMWWMSWCHH